MSIAKLFNQKPKTVSDIDFVARYRERARQAETFWSANYAAAKDDLKFLSGDQWPSGVKTERENEQRPCLVNNVLPSFVDQVLGDQRQNRPSIKISPVNLVDSKANQGEQEQQTETRVQSAAGNADYSLAETMSALCRNIEYMSDAETAYDLAFQAAVESGIGFLRLRTEWQDQESFYQTIKIEHINNQFSVLIDPNAKKFDKSDMNWAIVYESVGKDEFKRKYPDAIPEAPAGANEQIGAWYSENTNRVAEIYERESYDAELALLSDGRVVTLDDIKPVVDELIAAGVTVKRVRTVKQYKVIWRKVSGMDVLEGPVRLPCTTIPVVPVFGKLTQTEQGVIYRSIIRFGKDAQRMANYWDSMATESVALAPKAPFIADAEQVEGFETEWQEANTSNRAILRYNKTSPNDAGPQRARGANVPAAEITMAMNATEKIKSTLGMYDASLGNAGNETSGKAILARQRQGDRGSFAFIDNLSKSIRRVGQILVEMIPKVYETEQVVRLKFEDGTEDFVVLNQQIQDEQTGEWITVHDLNAAKYDVTVATGPSFATQRMESAESMIQFVQAFPQAAEIAGDLIAQNMDWPNADVLAKRLRKAVNPALLTADEQQEHEEDQPEKPPSPEQEVQMAELEARLAEAQADTQKSQADVEIALMKVKEAEAKLAQSSIDMKEQIEQTIAQALAQILP